MSNRKTIKKGINQDMNNSGDAAEQVVRISLETFEVAAKVTGEAAKNIAVLLVAAIKQEQKTKGKARLSNMIKSGEPLKVYEVAQKDLKKFTQEAKRYGVLYNVLRDKTKKGDNVTVDIIARASDASKIKRIFDKFELSNVDKANIVSEVNKTKAEKVAKEKAKPEKSKAEMVAEAAAKNPEEQGKTTNPDYAKTEKSPQSEQPSMKSKVADNKGTADKVKKPSVRDELKRIKADFEKQQDVAAPSRNRKLKVNKKPKKER